ncbi:hypothetical protein [Streptomyces fulvoviolaceus]|nr:hypothetical protein [Streptomyces fulvoviolaceus]MCT9081112.1 hypothetical protein [Streptomyces fulvoviolaceus]
MGTAFLLFSGVEQLVLGPSLADIDSVVGNEPLAAQVLAYCAELGLDSARMNPHAGSVARGTVVAAGGRRMAMVLERLARPCVGDLPVHGRRES